MLYLSWVFLTFCFVITTVESSSAEPEIYAEFVALNYTWDTTHRYSDYSRTKKFEPSNCLLAGIKVDAKGDIYVTVPRWRPHVPATLNKLVFSKEFNEYRLSPYPSWDMQEEGVNGDLQNCQSMAIDKAGLMWVIENGRRNFFSPVESMWITVTPGSWIINLSTSEAISKDNFPPDVASPSTSYVMTL